MTDWLSKFKYDPIKPLLESEDESVIYFTERDLLEKKVDAIDYVWNLKNAQNILKKQQPDGS